MEKGGVVQTEFEPLRSVENVFSSFSSSPPIDSISSKSFGGEFYVPN